MIYLIYYMSTTNEYLNSNADDVHVHELCSSGKKYTYEMIKSPSISYVKISFDNIGKLDKHIMNNILNETNCVVIAMEASMYVQSNHNILPNTMRFIKPDMKINKLYYITYDCYSGECQPNILFIEGHYRYNPSKNYGLNEFIDALKLNKYIKYLNIKFHCGSWTCHSWNCACFKEEKSKIINILERNTKYAQTMKILLMIMKLKYTPVKIYDNKNYCILPKPIMKIIIDYHDFCMIYD